MDFVSTSLHQTIAWVLTVMALGALVLRLVSRPKPDPENRPPEELHNLYGRLDHCDKPPHFRLWKVGTRRFYGVPESGILSPVVRKNLKAGTHLYGDFTILPAKAETNTPLPMVRVVSGKHLVLEEFNEKLKRWQAVSIEETWQEKPKVGAP